MECTIVGSEPGVCGGCGAMKLSRSLAPATFLMMTRVLALAASHLLPPSSPLLRESLGYVPAMA